MQLIQKLQDDKKCMKKVEPSSRLKAIEDIINIGSFVEALILNHYVLVRKILEDLEDLYKLVKDKYESTRPMEDLDLLLWGDLKTMFEPHVEDKVWRNQQEYKVLNWKLYDSYGVHSLMMQHVHIYMLVEKKYSLAPLTLSMMLEKKLIIDYESEMAYQLLKFIMKQLKKTWIRVKDSINNDPFKLREITDPESPVDAPRMRMYKYSDLTGEEMLRYEADIEAMNWILLGIPNDIYNSVDACQTAEQMWRQVQRFCTLINYMNCNNLIQNKIVVNTKFLNSLQPEWSKYVTRARQSDTLSQVDYDLLFDYLTQNEPDVNASREKRASRNHDPLALVANSYASPSSSRSS
ncbi:hypothetical protein Tco_0829540 [Tanacetum coccineum]